MSPDDFPQFDDPRVREVMAAAANLAEALDSPAKNISEACSGDEGCWCDVCDAKKGLKTALFAAQHSKPKNECANCGDYREAAPGSDHCQECLDDIEAGEAREAAQQSEPKEPSLIERLVEEMIAGDEETMRRLRSAFFEVRKAPERFACPKNCGDYTDERDVPCPDCLRG